MLRADEEANCATDPPLLSLRTLGATVRLLQLCFRSWVVDALLVLLIAACVGAYILFGYLLLLLPGEIYSALIDDDAAKFRTTMVKLFVTSCMTVISKTAIGLSRDFTTNRWRSQLTRHLHEKYFRAHPVPVFYEVCKGDTLDNPDQRICEDARSFTYTIGAIFAGGYGSGGVQGVGSVDAGALEALITVVWYSIQVLRRTGSWSLLVAYGWSSIVVIGGMVIVRHATHSIYRQEQLEASFRADHLEIKTKCEEAAFAGPGRFEMDYMNRQLELLIQNMKSVIRWRGSIALLDHWFTYFITFIMYLAIGVAVYSGHAEAHGMYTDAADKARWISQTGGVFIALLYSLTAAVQLNTPLASLVVQAARLDTILKEMDVDDIPGGGAQVVDAELKYETRAVEISVDRGESVLLTGPNGAGKTCLVRRLRGLWQPEGKCQRPPLVCELEDDGVARNDAYQGARRILFLTNRAYLPFCRPLLEQVAYPGTSDSPGAPERAVKVLEQVGLAHLVQEHGVQSERNWELTLSAGEQQRLALARVLWHVPAVAVLDEAMNCLDRGSERYFVDLFLKLRIGVVLVSHEQGCSELVDRVVRINR